MDRIEKNNIEVLGKIGHGSFGSLWLIKHQRGNLSVLKKISLVNMSKVERERSLQEVKILSTLNHPNIVSFKGFTKNDDYCCILMRYCEGGDFYNLIQMQKGFLFQEDQVVRWFIQIVMGIHYLHTKNIVHRDIKTQNLFLTKSGLVKVGDFGIAKHIDSTSQNCKSLIGTPFYMSPEIVAGAQHNEKSDIWSLGCCLFELLTLHHPFQAKDLFTLMAKVTSCKVAKIPDNFSEEICTLTHLLLKLEPKERPSATCILQTKFIRNHMKSFLSYTKRIEKTIGDKATRNILKVLKKDV